MANNAIVEFGAKGRRSSATERAKEIQAISGLISGKNVLITGGAAGLGFAFANHFLQHGVNKVTILDIDEAAGNRGMITLQKTYGKGRVIFIAADVARHEQMIEAFETATRAMDGIDIVVNNAGILDERRWEREIAVNIGGMISVAKLAMLHMGRDKGGRGGLLVNVGQHVDYSVTAQLPIYIATKHAVIGLSQSFAAPFHLERTGVRVLTLCPGLTETALAVNSPNKLMSRFMKADFVKNLELLSMQTPFVVAQGLLSILRHGGSGSIWVIENGRAPYEVYVPECRSLRRHYKNNFRINETIKVGKDRPIREECDQTRTGLTGCA